MTDWQLLRQYVEEKSETAFRRLVDKHMNLVYWTCRRAVSHAQLAEDSTQAVFLLLARKAGSLGKDISLSGWLFTTARLVSKNALRREAQQRKLELEIAENMRVLTSDSELSEIEPWLNNALASLPEADREVLLLRYFEGLSFQEVAAEVGASENTATKRAARAIEKLRRYLQKKHIAATAVILAAMLSQHAAKAAPQSCHESVLHAISQVASQNTVALAHVTLLQKGVFLTMQVAKYECLIIAGVIALAITGTMRIIHAHRANANTARATISIIDDSPADPAATAARREIEQDYRSDMENTLRGDFRRAPWIVPNMVTLTSGQRTVNTDQAIAKGSQTNREIIQGLNNASVTMTITTFPVNGAQAEIAYHLKVAGIVNGQSRVMRLNPPSGENWSADQDVVDRWEKTGGHWTMVGPEVETTPVMTVKYGASAGVITANGQVLSHTPGTTLGVRQ